MSEIDVRKGMPSSRIDKGEFVRRYRARFTDPAFNPLERELSAIINAAWDAYAHSRKSSRTRKAGAGFADPQYDLATDWLAARDAIIEAQRRHDDPQVTPRILLINGPSRSENTCPGEMSKSWRLLKLRPLIREGRMPRATCGMGRTGRSPAREKAQQHGKRNVNQIGTRTSAEQNAQLLPWSRAVLTCVGRGFFPSRYARIRNCVGSRFAVRTSC